MGIKTAKVEDLMDQPFFSVITCTWNSERYIEKLIDSVIGQTDQNYEHIIIDGESTDNTIKIIQKYQKRFPSKVKIYKRHPQGISDALNYGMEKCVGKYLIHIESDSSFFDKKVLNDVHVYLTKNPELDWIYGKIDVVNELGNSLGIFPTRKIFQLALSWLVKYFNFIPHESVFMRRAVFEDYGGFDESIRTAMDLDYWLRIRYVTKWKFFNRIIAHYGIRPDALSSSAKNRKRNMDDIETVLRRYSSPFESYLLKIINLAIDRYNKTYR